jgi:alkaline phosphatase
MPRGRSTFNKRQKEQARQQKQRDKNERKTQRRQDQPEGVTVVDEEEELRQMREHAAEQAALFGLGSDDEPEPSDLLPPRKQVER